MIQNPCCDTVTKVVAYKKEKKTRKSVLTKWFTTFVLEGAEHLSKIR